MPNPLLINTKQYSVCVFRIRIPPVHRKGLPSLAVVIEDKIVRILCHCNQFPHVRGFEADL